jgi:hypothetical protein
VNGHNNVVDFGGHVHVLVVVDDDDDVGDATQRSSHHHADHHREMVEIDEPELDLVRFLQQVINSFCLSAFLLMIFFFHPLNFHPPY